MGTSVGASEKLSVGASVSGSTVSAAAGGAVSAGTGAVLLEDSHAEEVRCAENAYTKKAHYIVGVKGDSMEPAYSDGDLLLIRRDSVGFGQVGIFFMDGMGYLKQRGRDELISLNPAYPPIPMDESIVCEGRVIGILDPAWVVG